MPPAPRPRVICLPMLRRLGARDLSRAWESVLMAQNDTPSILVWIMRFTAFPPPPPTPRTCKLNWRMNVNDWFVCLLIIPLVSASRYRYVP